LSVSLKMDKIEYCAVIKFLVKEGLMPNEIHLKFIKVYGNSSPLFSTIKKWAAEFKCGRTSQNSGQKLVVERQRRQVRFHRQERSWHRCFGMLKAFCLLIILKRVKQ